MKPRLWFAWKIVPLRYTKQPGCIPSRFPRGCDLLEKSYLCGIQNNWRRLGYNYNRVVICLKNRTFAVYKTTYKDIYKIIGLLWFAWKIVPLRYTKQPAALLHGGLVLLWFAWKIVPLRYTKQLVRTKSWTLKRCDLLEKSYLCGIQNNLASVSNDNPYVVICLKNRTFAVYKTTFMIN